MFKSILFTTAALGFLSACSNTNQLEVAAENDWCISGGTIYTAEDDKPTVEAVAVKNGQIVLCSATKVGDWCNANARLNNVRDNKPGGLSNVPWPYRRTWAFARYRTS